MHETNVFQKMIYKLQLGKEMFHSFFIFSSTMFFVDIAANFYSSTPLSNILAAI